MDYLAKETQVNLRPENVRIYGIPEDVIEASVKHFVLADLMVTRAGYFPKALGHETRRTNIPEYIMIHCLDGKGWFYVNDYQCTVGKGQIAFVFPGCRHGYGADSDDPWTVQWAHMNGNHIAGLLQLANISVDNPVVTVGERLNLITLFNEILTTLQSGYSLHRLINASACLRQVLSNIALLVTYSPSVGTNDLNAEQVINYMLTHIRKQRSLDDFATEACMSRSHFSRKFHQKTGYAPVDYFIRLKVQKACELLETTDMKVGEVARYLGYGDQYYFSRTFKKIMGVSPKVYRTTRRE